MRYGASGVWHPSLPLTIIFNKTKAAFFVQAMLPEGFPFHQFNLNREKNFQMNTHIRLPVPAIDISMQ